MFKYVLVSRLNQIGGGWSTMGYSSKQCKGVTGLENLLFKKNGGGADIFQFGEEVVGFIAAHTFLVQ